MFVVGWAWLSTEGVVSWLRPMWALPFRVCSLHYLLLLERNPGFREAE